MKMLPRLQAEEQLRAIDAVGHGTGSYAADTTRAALSELRSKALATDDDAPIERPRASPEELASMGIGVTIVGDERAASDV